MSRAVFRSNHPNIRTAKNAATESRWRREHAPLVHRRNTNVKLVEPPSCSSPSAIIFIGRNSRGDWVAQEQNGLFGGLFVNRAQAMKYALFENGDHPATIVLTSNIVELDMHRKALPSPSPQTVEADESSRQIMAA